MLIYIECIRKCTICVSRQNVVIELSSRIGVVIENNVWRKCMHMTYQWSLVFSTSVWNEHSRVRRAVIVVWISKKHSCELLGDSGERRRIAFFAHTGKAKMPNENPWQRRVMLYGPPMCNAFLLLNDYANIFEDATE